MMNYSDIIQAMMDGLYQCDIEFPPTISFPILLLKDEKIYDLFFVEGEEQPLREDTVSVVYMQNIADVGDFCLYKTAEEIHPLFADEKKGVLPDFSPSEEDSFPTLYMKVRAYAFRRDLTAEQREKVIQLAGFYQKLLDPEYAAFYRCLSPAFFVWAKEIATMQ